MIIGNVKIFFSVFVILKIRLLYAQHTPLPTNSNQGVPPSSGPPGFFDPGSMGPGPNFGSGRFGNPTSNYPANAFFPFGNQNNQPGSGPRPQNPNFGNLQNRPIQGYPNQQDYPYQGNTMHPNYQQNSYPNNQNPNAGNFPNRPIQEGLPNQGSPFQGASPNYQRPQYPNDVLTNPGNLNRPYQNGGMPLNPNQNYQRPMPGEFLPGRPVQNGQYPFQSNSNFRPGVSNLRPDMIYFPGETSNQNQPNQYYPQNNFSNQNGQSFGSSSGVPSTPSNAQPNFSDNFAGSNGQVPPNNGNNNFNQAQPQSPNTNAPNYNDTVAVLGKPVIITPAMTGQAAFDVSTENPTQKKCVQDCPSTSEYDPVCGTNNVTYINPGKLLCAQKCGEEIQLYRTGRCPGDINSV